MHAMIRIHLEVDCPVLLVVASQLIKVRDRPRGTRGKRAKITTKIKIKIKHNQGRK